MRGRLALAISGVALEHREILLRDKPAAMLEASPKGTVPVVVLPDGRVIDESLDVMLWALEQNDPDEWLEPGDAMMALIKRSDGPFKHDLDRYKYGTSRYEGADPMAHRADGLAFLETLDERLALTPQLFGERMCLADAAIFPFVRQFANTDRDWFDAQDLPNLQAWLTAHLASPLFARVMAKHELWAPES